MRRHEEALDELRRAAKADPMSGDIHRALGYAAVRVGDFATALTSWEQYLRTANGDPGAERVRAALEAAKRLMSAVDGGSDE